MIVIGAGISGLYASKVLSEKGFDVTLIESKSNIGGVYYGFKNPTIDGVAITHYIDELKESLMDKIRIMLNTTAIDIKNGKLRVLTPKGLESLDTDYIILAVGGHEINRYDLRIYGYNVSGIFSGVLAYKLMMRFNKPIGSQVVIYGDREYLLDVAERMEELGSKIITWIAPRELNFKTETETLLGKVAWAEGKGRLSKIRIISMKNEIELSCDALVVGFGFKPKTRTLSRFGVPVSKEIPDEVEHRGIKILVVGHAKKNYITIKEMLGDIEQKLRLIV